MQTVVEILGRESGTRDFVTDGGDVRSEADFCDPDGEIIDIPDKVEPIVLLSERDRRIHELEAARDAYEEWLENKADKLGWSIDSVRSQEGEFPGAKELAGLIDARDREATRAGVAGVLAELDARKQAKINAIVDPVARRHAQLAFDSEKGLREERNKHFN